MPEIGETENKCAGLSRAAVAPVWRLFLCLAASFPKAQSPELPEPRVLLGKGAAGSGHHLLIVLCLYPPTLQGVSTKSDENQGLKSKTQFPQPDSEPTGTAF